MSLNLARKGFPEAVPRGAGGALRVAIPWAASQTAAANSTQAAAKPNDRVPVGSPARIRRLFAFMPRSPLINAAAFTGAAHFERNHTVRLKGVSTSGTIQALYSPRRH